MSYDVAVWAGPRPADDESAEAEYERRADVLEDDDDLPPPSPALAAFLDELLTVLPPLDESDDPRSPWATGPEPGDVSGDFAYLTMTYPGAEAALDTVVEVAGRHGLVCFDPQDGRLL
ncbi:hypothetical protein [Blastococcus atacamensis]|uniref:hypothetical protein n=1 Tax=Blastococcus atacamensis TaxID=2070508 RepID=UPI000CEB95AD|nr:hypothetical protein [Blastococcus atacamensis]